MPQNTTFTPYILWRAEETWKHGKHGNTQVAWSILLGHRGHQGCTPRVDDRGQQATVALAD